MRTLLILLISAVFLFSCETTEKIYIKEDNSITYVLDTDLSNLMAVGLKEDSGIAEHLPIDTVMTFKEFNESELKLALGGSSNEIDFNEIDPIFKDFKIHLKINEDNGNFSYFTKQENINALNAVLKNMKTEADKLASKDDDINKPSIENLMYSLIFQEKKFQLENNQFNRFNKVNLGSLEELLDSDNEELNMLQIFGFNSFKSEYHFPRPVKFVSDTTVKLSWDRKTVYVEKSIRELYKNPNALDIKIELERE